MKKIRLTAHIRSLIEKKHIDLRSKGRLTESYSLGILSPLHSCKTGCWTYNKDTKKHEIKISPEAYHTIATPSLGAGVRKSVPALFTEVYEHEAAHSLYTTKDLKALNDKLKEHKIPWRLMNLFEDIRIESIWTRLRRRAFKWLLWEKYPDDLSTLTPAALLYHMKNDQAGFSRKLSRKFYGFFGAAPFFRDVATFFYRIRACHLTEALIPILIDWLKKFPDTGDDSIEGEGGLGTGDLKSAIEASCGEAVVSVPKGEKASSEKGGGAVGKHDASGTAHAFGDGDMVEAAGSPEIALEFSLAARLAAMLATAFKGEGVTRGATSRPTRRLNLREILRKSYDLPYIGKVLGRTGVPHISLLFDGSGSMAGVECYVDRERTTKLRVDQAGRILLLALSTLARKGKIKCDVYLCAAGGVAYRATLPFKNYAQAEHFRGYSGAEGFGLALSPTTRSSKGCFADVSKRRLAICYTDGNIVDEPIDKVALRERGVTTLGLCCSERDYTEVLKEHFDYPISRESLWGMADALVRMLRLIKA